MGRRKGGREEVPLALNQEISRLAVHLPLPSLYCLRGLVRDRQERQGKEVRGGQAAGRAGKEAGER